MRRLRQESLDLSERRMVRLSLSAEHGERVPRLRQKSLDLFERRIVRLSLSAQYEARTWSAGLGLTGFHVEDENQLWYERDRVCCNPFHKEVRWSEVYNECFVASQKWIDTVVSDDHAESKTCCQILRRPHNLPALGCFRRRM